MIIPNDRPDLAVDRFGVIFIDCWETDWTWTGQTGFYQGIKQHLSRLPIVSKVFHTTFLKLDMLGLEVLNYFKTFVDNNPSKLKYFKALLDNAGDEILAKELWEILDWQSIFIPTLDAFDEYVGRVGVQNWIVVGAHWKICTHTKPLGLNNLKKLKKSHPHINFYVIPECLAKWKSTPAERVCHSVTWEDLQNDDLKWSRHHSYGLARLES